ncbi:Uncharacterised protein [uncultured Clostridium sp.]|nr:Uncharacterised protein [uncultured Clostridium sp.]
MDPLYDIRGFRQVDTVGAVDPLKLGQTLIDLKDHRTRVFKNRPPGIVGNSQAAVAVPIRFGHRDEGHIDPDIAPVELRQGPEHHRQKLHQPSALQLPLIVPDMPAVVGERGLLRVALHHLDPGPDHQAAPDLDVFQLLFSRRKRPVHQFGKARAKAVIYPVAGSNRFCRHFGSNKFTHIVLYHLFSPSKIYIAIFLKRLMSLDTLLDPHIIMVQTFCPCCPI